MPRGTVLEPSAKVIEGSNLVLQSRLVNKNWLLDIWSKAPKSRIQWSRDVEWDKQAIELQASTMGMVCNYSFLDTLYCRNSWYIGLKVEMH